MDFDKWFNSQSTLVKVILLLIPGINWVVEILVRLSLLLRVKNNTGALGGGAGEVSVSRLTMFLVALCFGLFISYIDIICVLMSGHLIMAENE